MTRDISFARGCRSGQNNGNKYQKPRFLSGQHINYTYVFTTQRSEKWLHNAGGRSSVVDVEPHPRMSDWLCSARASAAAATTFEIESPC